MGGLAQLSRGSASSDRPGSQTLLEMVAVRRERERRALLTQLFEQLQLTHA